MSDTFVPLSRREFGLSLGGCLLGSRLFGADSSLPWMGPATIKKVFLAVPQPTWPRPDLDVAREKAELEVTLSELERKHAGSVVLTGGDLVRTPEQAEAFAKSVGDADGLLIIDLTSGTGPLLRPFRDLATPTLLFARPYSGWSYVDVTTWAQNGKKADLVSTSEAGDLDPYMRIFRTIHHLRRSKVLVINAGTGPNRTAEAFTRQFGTAFGFPGYQDLKSVYESMDAGQARTAAGEFARGALKVVEPSMDDITASMRLYHAVLKLLDREKANAITIDCLGGFKRGDLPAYPCVAWSKLNDAGSYGVCEGDIHSTITQLLLTSFTGKPGFVSDPVFDTSRNEVIHAHCVAATAMHGVGATSSPYLIRSHMEDNKGVSMQVMMPIQETVTLGKFLDPATFSVSTGEVIGNVDNPRGCRTKVRTRVADARKMLENYRGGLHRVLFYGDYLRPVEQMGRMMGFKIVREC